MACAVPNQDRVIVTKFITSGAVPTIPTVADCDLWNPRDIEEAEIVVNTRDKRVFTRAGNSIIELTNQSSGGSGTVTSFAGTNAQGVSWSVSNPTTTPNATLTLGALTGVTSLNGLIVTANTGVITTGTWQATAIADAYIASASTWNAKVSTGVITGSGLTMATSRILGRTTAGTGAIEEISIGSGLSLAAGTLSATGSAVALSAITAATATNTINNVDYLQTWNWDSADTESALTLTANNLTTGSILSVTSSGLGVLNSTNGLLYVANTSADTGGVLARFQANSTSGTGVTMLTSGFVGVNTVSPTLFAGALFEVKNNFNGSALISVVNETAGALAGAEVNVGISSTRYGSMSYTSTSASPSSLQDRLLFTVAAAGKGMSFYQPSGATITASSGVGMYEWYSNNQIIQRIGYTSDGGNRDFRQLGNTTGHYYQMIWTSDATSANPRAFFNVEKVTANNTVMLFGTYGGSLVEAMRLTPTQSMLMGTTTDVASSILTLASTSRGFLPPRMTSGQWTAIGTKAQGLLAYDTTNQNFVYTDTTSGITHYIGNCIFSQTNDVTVANTVTETTILGTGKGFPLGTPTLDIGDLTVGKNVQVKVRGIISDTGTPTIRVRVKLGATTIGDTGAIALTGTVTNEEFAVDYMLTCRTTGVTGTVIGSGTFQFDNSASAGLTFGMPSTGTTTIDTTAALAVNVTVEWGAADPANTITSQVATIHLV